jgi:hypothetical protein
VIAPLGFRIGHQQTAGLISLIAQQLVLRFQRCKIVSINEIFPGVVGRVDVDHLHLAQIALLQELQGIEVVPFDEQVLGGVEVDAFIPARTQGLGDWGVCSEQRLALARPIEPVAFLRAFNDVIGQLLAQLVEINGESDSALIVSSFSHAIGEQCTNFCDIVLAKVRAMHLQLIHAQSIHTSI